MRENTCALKSFKASSLIFLSIALSLFVSQISFAGTTAAAYSYLSGRIKGIGLVDSYRDDSSASYTYDNALAVIAFVAQGDFEKGRIILANYQDTIGIPSYFGYNDEYDYKTGSGSGYTSAGPNAWLLNAINFYFYKTNDPRFLTLGQKLADFLVRLQDAGDGGLFGDPYVSWKSAEHNFIGYAALYNYGILTNQDLYVQKANLVKDFLVRECWNGERFLRGKNDQTEVTDVQAMGVLALGTAYASGIYWAEYHTKCTKPLGALPVTGFDFNNDLDTVWLEGTLQQSMAFKRNYDNYRAGIYFGNVDKTQRSDGSFLCATNQGTAGGDWILLPVKAVAPTCWYIFYNTNTNPFMR